MLNTITLQIVPCNKKGKEYTENDDIWVDNPAELIGKDLHFNAKILSARGIPSRFTVSIFQISGRFLSFISEQIAWF